MLSLKFIFLTNCRCRYDNVIDRLHFGDPCRQCGMCFTKAQKQKYRDHLDWHFQQNMKIQNTILTIPQTTAKSREVYGTVSVSFVDIIHN